MNTTILVAAIFGTGFTVAVLLQKQLAAVGASAYITAIFSGVGFMYTLFKELQDRKKRKEVPSLSFDRITMNERLKAKAYSIKLILSQSSEEAKNCHPYLALQG